MIPHFVKEAASHLRLFTYKGYMGLFWYLLDSFLLFLTFIFLRNVVTLSDIEFYALYLFVGISMFNFFRRATTQSMHAIRQAHKKKEKDSLLTCIYRASVPVTHVAMMHSLELVLVVVILLYYKISLVGIILYAPFLILLVMIFMCIAGVLLYFRFYWSNITQLWMLLLRMLFFVTPIFYSTKFLLINHINPIFYMVDTGRSLLISKDITTAISVTITALILGVSMKLVKRVQ